ncbi:unnamed protein product [Soboliphyme baturini]|uniref:IF-2 domain-containing protein n=1 Tax=Soboliphyme baturini TaxID=241478 RepID=A0A183J7D4_9BILA|nr:unnamed protein product [Soboliphyme baturini]
MKRLQAGFFRRDPRLKILRGKEAVGMRNGPRLAIIVKADVDGSLEAILDVFSTYTSEKCWFDLVEVGVGPVTENDIDMAETFNAIVYCFNTPESPVEEKLAKSKQVDIRKFNIIYRLVEDWKSELNNQLPLVTKERIVGEGVVLKEFLITEKGKKLPVAGCRVTKGTLKKKCFIKFLRNGEVFYNGVVTSMKREKEVVGSGNVNEEVGLMVADSDIRFLPDDIVQCYETYDEPQEIDWFPPGF